MTRKSHALAELPLLGSNQDSPDPESAGFGQFTGSSAGFGGRSAPEHQRLTHGFTHGFSPAVSVAAAPRRPEAER